MVDLTTVSCFLDLSKPTDLLSCFSNSNGFAVWNIVFLALLALAVAGISLSTDDIFKGLMLGGFLSTLLGLGFVALDLVSIKVWVIALTLMLVGLILSIINTGKND